MNSDSSATPLKAAIFQYQYREETPDDRIRRLDKVLSGLGQSTVDLLVCPELYHCGYCNPGQIIRYAEPANGPFSQKVAQLARNWKTAVIYGYSEQDLHGRFNSATCIDEDGKIIANHRKLRLFGTHEKGLFQCGDHYTVFDLRGHRLALLICYDAEFPENVRACAKEGSGIMVVPTAAQAQFPFVSRYMMPVRAFENGGFLLYANLCGEGSGTRFLGESRIVSPIGTDLAVAGRYEEIIVAKLDPALQLEARGKIPYLNDCNGLSSMSIIPNEELRG